MARHSELAVVERPELHLVGQSIITTLKEVFEQGSAQRLKEAVLSRASEVQNRVGQETYLMEIYPDTDNFNLETPFTTFIGFAVATPAQVPAGMVSHNLPASRYLKTTHYGMESELSETYGAIFRTEIPQGGYHYKHYHFEQWDHRYQPESPSCEIDIYFAIK